MSTQVEAAVIARAPAWTAPAVLVLGRREARRMLTSPVYVLITVWFVAYFVVGAAEGMGLRANLHDLINFVLVYGALASLFVVGLVASSPRRSGAESMLAATPSDLRRRTLATGLGVLFGPAALGGLLTVALAYLAARPGPQLQDAFRGVEYLQLPLLWLGTGLLGLAAARWLPWPGAPLAVLVGLIAWSVTSYKFVEDGRWIGFLAPNLITSETATESWLWPRSPDADLGWHAAYLLGLCLLALTAALLRDAGRRTVLILGVPATVLTVAAAWLQLP